MGKPCTSCIADSVFPRPRLIRIVELNYLDVLGSGAERFCQIAAGAKAHFPRKSLSLSCSMTWSADKIALTRSECGARLTAAVDGFAYALAGGPQGVCGLSGLGRAMISDGALELGGVIVVAHDRTPPGYAANVRIGLRFLKLPGCRADETESQMAVIFKRTGNLSAMRRAMGVTVAPLSDGTLERRFGSKSFQ